MEQEKQETIKYFHEISQEEVDNLITNEETVDYVLKNYKQPEWCGYHQALSMTFGCWSLCDLKKDGLRTKISEDFCRGCDCFKDNLSKQKNRYI